MEQDAYDLIILDPPYASDLLEKTLKYIIEFDILAEGGIIICETGAEKTVPQLDAPYYTGREYKYGKVHLTVCGRNPD